MSLYDSVQSFSLVLRHFKDKKNSKKLTKKMKKRTNLLNIFMYQEVKKNHDKLLNQEIYHLFILFF